MIRSFRFLVVSAAVSSRHMLRTCREKSIKFYVLFWQNTDENFDLFLCLSLQRTFFLWCKAKKCRFQMFSRIPRGCQVIKTSSKILKLLSFARVEPFFSVVDSSYLQFPKKICETFDKHPKKFSFSLSNQLSCHSMLISCQVSLCHRRK